MALTIEKILGDACNLSMRLKEHDVTADSLISRTQALQHQVEAMKQVCATRAVLLAIEKRFSYCSRVK